MSGTRFLLDTNILIGHLAGREEARRLLIERDVDPETAAASQITRMELLAFPSITGSQEASIREFLSTLRIILIDEDVEAAAIALRRQKRLKLPDAIIVASAQVHGL